MGKNLDPQQLVTVEELAISSMWEMAALVDALDQRGNLMKGM